LGGLAAKNEFARFTESQRLSAREAA